MTSIFHFESYREAVKAKLLDRRSQVGPSFTYDKLAKACGIQKTYLSRVLNSSSAHLSEEQLYLAAKYLGMPKAERDFLQQLRKLDRAVKADYRIELSKEIDAMRRKHLRTENFIPGTAEAEVTTDWSGYYLDPHIMLTHIFLTVELYRKDLAAICAALRVSRGDLDKILTTLESMQLIRLTESGYVVTNHKTHLSADSSLYKSFRALQRVKALEQLNRLDGEKAYSFSVAFSSNPKVRQAIHEKILRLIGDVEKLVSASAETDVYQLNIDLFDWV